jgi:hypothetical protein
MLQDFGSVLFEIGHRAEVGMTGTDPVAVSIGEIAGNQEPGLPNVF